ncbi:hypothetical protein SUGI_0174890 [Cryptomeria japonica]|uniref:RNA-dependent RNA polymerase 1 n=1 Tax=Cryptomeria japonica TaxID=3369 RepID=UPI0024089979|nr:RNA-dependent RNA polymerase 1 [Cryptomeria japonica]GLJ11696.1 hypothetical protein SUGI_0174890 [Cryptomeria japonica]
MAGRTIHVSRVPFIPNEKFLVECLENTVGRGNVRACRLITQSSMHSQEDAEVSALVETASAESAMDLHNLAKAGLLDLWGALLAVQFVHNEDFLSQSKVLPQSNDAACDPNFAVPQLHCEAELSVPKDVSENNTSLPRVVSEPKIEDVYESKASVSQLFSQPKVSVPGNLSENKVSVPAIVPESNVSAVIEPKFSMPPPSQAYTFPPFSKAVSKPKPVNDSKVVADRNLPSERKGFVPKIFTTFELQAVSAAKISTPKDTVEPRPVHDTNLSVQQLSGIKASVVKVFDAFELKIVSSTKASAPKAVPKSVYDPNLSVPQLLSEIKASVLNVSSTFKPNEIVAEPKPRYDPISERKASLLKFYSSFEPAATTSAPKAVAEPNIAPHREFSVPKRNSELKVGSRSKEVSAVKETSVCLEGVDLHMGCEISEISFYVLCSFNGVIAEFEYGRKRISLFVRASGTDYKMDIEYPDIRYIHRGQATGKNTQVLLLRLRNAPRIYSKMSPVLQSDTNGCNYKDLKDAQWIRTTDFTQCCCIGQSLSFSLELPNSIDISHIQNKFAHYKEIEEKILLEHGRPFNPTSILVPIISPPEDLDIPYKIMFKINSLVQQGILSWPTLSKEFFNLLLPERRPADYIYQALTKLSNSGWNTCYRPVDWLTKELGMLEKSKGHLHSEEISLDNGLMCINRVQITPSKIYFCGPEVNVSNRVTRHFAEYIDNFLRVSFVDENLNTLSSRDLSQWMGRETPQKHTKIYERILSVLKEGILIGNKIFEFLAFSSSQLRESSLWMFASTESLSADDIRKWLGNFVTIKCVAKCATRMGQSFSSSTETVDVASDEFEYIPDIEVHSSGKKYIFSDGIGKISSSLAEEVARKCGCEKKPPSAFQIRYAGYKGVVAIDPASNHKLSLRPSMRKYTSNNISLDVLSWTKYGPCFLNRQIITLLSSLGVKDENFEILQKQAVAHLDNLLNNRDDALGVLHILFSGESHHLLTDMLSCGYCPSSEPYLSMMLQAFRASKCQELRSKARIFVPKGRCLMGCLDETGTLNYGEVFIQISRAPGNKQFHDDGNHANSIIEGKVFVAKNPCLHPGDIRVLLAKNTLKLHHMIDCIVFPQHGRRPHPNECSGSDLDGDLYFTSWDESLIPSQEYMPMDYVAKPLIQLDRNVTIEDMQEHFANHIVNDTLGIIANSHLAFADQEPDMARSHKCLQLAELHSTAVDFAKTGVAAEIPPELHPKRYPDFMEKEDKETYESTRVLGKLYRSVSEAAPQNSNPYFAEKAYDKDLEVLGYERYLEKAFEYKARYDSRLAALMDHYGIKNEAEIISGNIESMSNFVGSNKRYGYVRETIMSAVKSLKKEARGWFDLEDSYNDVCGGTKKLAKASAWYYVTYHPSYWGKRVCRDDDDAKIAHLISFPWVLFNVLLHIKRTKQQQSHVSCS